MNMFNVNVVLVLCSLFISLVNGVVKYVDDDDAEDVGNPDDDAIIERPCEIHDIRCIRKYFADHAKCTIANGPLPDPTYRTQTNYYVPKSNFTGVLTEIKLTGFNNTRVEEFYINRRTNNLIIALNFRQIALNIPSAYFKFYRRGREPIVNFLTFATVLINAFTVTVIIPNAQNLQFEHAEMTPDVQAASFTLSPTVFIPPDIQVLRTVASFYINFPAVANEVAFPEVYYYGSVYLQSNICDFGFEI